MSNYIGKLKSKKIMKEGNPNKYYKNLDCNRKRFFVDIIEKMIINNTKVLDVGSYPFAMMKSLFKKGIDIYGVDKQYSNRKLVDRIFNCDIQKEKFPFKDNTFDIVILSEVIEHLGENPIFCIREIRRVLKENGILILSTDNNHRFDSYIKFLFYMKTGYYYNIRKIYENGFMGHIKEYSFKEIEEVFINEGFEKLLGKYISFEIVKNKKFSFLTNLIYKFIPIFRPKLFFIFKKTKNFRNN